MSAPSFSHRVIRASAGSGKTFQLTNRYIALLSAGVPCAEIWATTFTRKAAGEILDRVVKRLAEAGTKIESASDLAKQIDRLDLKPTDFVKLLRSVLAHLHHMRIGTLDSVFQKIAGAFAFELDLPPHWSIGEDADAVQANEDALEAVLATDNGRDSWLARLIERFGQNDAKRSVRADLLERVSKLHDFFLDIPQDGWQTNPPATPQESLDDLLAEMRRFDLSKLDKRMASARDKDHQKVADREWEGFVSGGLAAKVYDGTCAYYKKRIPTELVDCYRRLQSFARCAIQNEYSSELAAVREFLHRFDAEHAKARQVSGKLRFHDVARALASGFDRCGQGFDYRIDGRVAHLLLDEFQDTSMTQWKVLKALALQSTSSGGTFFGVGDVKQAIYGWRGGRAELLDRLPAELGTPPAEPMDISRRSSQSVIDAVNRVFDGIVDVVDGDKATEAVSRWKRRFNRHTTVREKVVGLVHLETGPDWRGLERDAARVRHYEWCAKNIRDIVAARPDATVGVLCRTNTPIARLIFELRRVGVAASEEGKGSITDSAAVDIILSILALADHPADTVARFHLQNCAAINMLRERGLDPENDGFSRRVRGQLLADGYGAFVRTLADALAPICPRADRRRLGQLVEIADAYSSRATLRPSDFVRWVRAQNIEAPSSDHVRVLTIHGAKGLEFDAVVLPQLDVSLRPKSERYVAVDPDPPRLPHGFLCRRVPEGLRPIVDEEISRQCAEAETRAMEESLSLLYVALTRAREALYLFPPGPQKTNRSDCWDGILLKALKPDFTAGKDRLAETIAFTVGDANWRPVGRETMESRPLSPPSAIRFRESDPTQRRLEWVAPSKLEGGRIASAARHFESSNSSFNFGTLIHAWFELIEWLDDGEPNDEMLRTVARRLDWPADTVDNSIRDFREALARPAIRSLLHKSAYVGNRVRADRERRIGVRIDKQFLSGSIDRIVWWRDEMNQLWSEIIDFKTDRVDESNIGAKVEYYRPQIEAYCRAVAVMAHIPMSRISSKLAFTTSGRVESLSHPVIG